MIPPPILPLPPREFFKSDDAYLAAKKRHNEQMKHREAGDLIHLGMWCLMLLFAFCSFGYILGGIGLAIGAPLGMILFFVGVMRFQDWLAKRL